MAIPPLNRDLNTCYWCKEQLDTEPHNAHPVAGTDTPSPPGIYGGHGGYKYMMGHDRCWRESWDKYKAEHPDQQP